MDYNLDLGAVKEELVNIIKTFSSTKELYSESASCDKENCTRIRATGSRNN